MKHSNAESNNGDETARKQALSDPIEAVIDEIKNSVDRLTAITLRHPLLEDEMHSIQIIVYTDDRSEPLFDPMQHATVTEAVIDIKDGRQIGIPYDIHTSTDDPAVTETVNITPVYRSDDVAHTDPITVEDGLDRLRWKLGTTRDEIQLALQEKE
jgi:hypothetical protein